MSVSAPFLDPWDILYELGPILEEINKDFPNIPKTNAAGEVGYKHSPEYSAAFEWKKKIEQCSWKLPSIHEAIVKRQKISQGGGCCGLKDLCELLGYIQELRPATKGKVLDAGWRTDYEEKIHRKLCCLINIDEEESIQGMNTFPNIIEIPTFSVDGLPGFEYPNYRIPPIIQLIRPSEYRTDKSSDVPNASSKFTYGSGAEYPVAYVSSNVDGVSKVFGRFNMVGETFTSSPFKTKRSWVCEEGLGGDIDDLLDLDQNLSAVTKDFKVTQGCSINIPNLKVSIDIVLPINECVSQFLPPMFLPKHRLDVLSLGNGEEIGIFSNFKLLASNFGTQFKVNSNRISPLVQSSPFDKSPCTGGNAPTGVDRKRSLW